MRTPCSSEIPARNGIPIHLSEQAGPAYLSKYGKRRGSVPIGNERPRFLVFSTAAVLKTCSSRICAKLRKIFCRNPAARKSLSRKISILPLFPVDRGALFF